MPPRAQKSTPETKAPPATPNGAAEPVGDPDRKRAVAAMMTTQTWSQHGTKDSAYATMIYLCGIYGFVPGPQQMRETDPNDAVDEIHAIQRAFDMIDSQYAEGKLSVEEAYARFMQVRENIQEPRR